MKVAGAGGVGSALSSCFVLDGLGLGAAFGEALAAGGGPEKRARLPCEGFEVDEEAAAGLEGPGAEEGALRLAICCSRLKLRGERGRQSSESRQFCVCASLEVLRLVSYASSGPISTTVSSLGVSCPISADPSTLLQLQVSLALSHKAQTRPAPL